MTNHLPNLAQCLADLSRRGGEPDPEFLGLWVPALLTDPAVARSLVLDLVTGTPQDSVKSLPEHELLSYLLDEARRAEEDGRDAGTGFLHAAEAALAETEPEEMTTEGLGRLASLYARAGIAVPESLQDLYAGRIEAEPGDDDLEPEQVLQELERGLQQLLDDCDGDLLAAHGALVETIASMPGEPRLGVIHRVAAHENALWQRLAQYWLLDREPAVREAVARAYRDHAHNGTLDAQIASRLPLLRSWLPGDTARRQVDEALTAVRRRGAGGVAFPDAGHIGEIQASLPDGAGAQYFAIATGTDRNRRWAMVLTKTGYGVRDAYLLPGLDDGDEQAILDQLVGGMDAVPVATETLHCLLAAAMGEGLAREEPPAPGLLDVVAACGLTELRPQPLTHADWLARLDPAGELAHLTPQKRGRLINAGAEWADEFGMLDTWFEQSSECDRVLATAHRPADRQRVLRAWLEERRPWWAGQCLRAALVLRDSIDADTWRSFAVTGAALLEGRALKRIPVMEQILEATIDAWEDRDAALPEPLDPDADPDLDLFDDAFAPDFAGGTSVSGFTEQHRRTLQAFYDTGPGASVWEAGYFGLHGYLFAVTTHPEPLMPSSWLPPLLGEGGRTGGRQGAPALDESEDLAEVVDGLMNLYNSINNQVLEDEVGLPDGCELHRQPLDNFWPDAPVGQWSRGFSEAREHFGHLFELMQEEFGEEDEVTFNCGIATMLVELLGDRQHAEDLVSTQPGPDTPTLEQLAADACESFERELHNLASLARVARQSGIDEEFADAGEPPDFRAAPVQPVRREKIGRNSPCPCGSGRKYKRCCGDPRRE